MRDLIERGELRTLVERLDDDHDFTKAVELLVKARVDRLEAELTRAVEIVANLHRDCEQAHDATKPHACGSLCAAKEFLERYLSTPHNRRSGDKEKP